MKRYLLNSAVITAPGTYTYEHVTREMAREWYFATARPISTIGYEQTAEALGCLLEARIEVDRRSISMEPGDEALVFRLVLPPGSPRLEPGDKGRLNAAVAGGDWELGLLIRTA